MPWSIRAALLLVFLVCILEAYHFVAPPTPNRVFRTVELQLPTAVHKSESDNATVIEYAGQPSLESAQRVLNLGHDQYTSFQRAKMEANGRVVVRVSDVITYSPFGRRIREDACAAVIFRIGNRTNCELLVVKVPR